MDCGACGRRLPRQARASLVLHHEDWRGFLNGREIKLKNSELLVLFKLASAKGVTVRCDILADAAGSKSRLAVRTIIYRLRRKGVKIETVPLVGYRLVGTFAVLEGQ